MARPKESQLGQVSFLTSNKRNILRSKNIIPPAEKAYMESRTSNKYIQIHQEWTFPVKNRLSRKMIILPRRCPLTNPSPPPCSPTSPTYATREVEKEEVWTYLTNGAMSQFVSALVAFTVTVPLVITATSY